MSDPAPSSPRRSAAGFWVIALLVLLAAGGSWVLNSTLTRFARDRQAELPVLGQPAMDFAAVERNGKERNLAELKGKVIVLAYTYTRCARGCAGVSAQMLKLRDVFQGNSKVFFVSVAAWPLVDTPPMLAAFAEGIGVRAEDPWWWLATDREKTWQWMTREVGFEPSSEIPQQDRLNPEDVVAHDLRAVLIDPQGRLRGFYQVMHPQTEVAQMSLEKLEKDIRSVLEE